MKRFTGYLFAASLLLASCGPVEYAVTPYTQPVTQIPFYGTESPVTFIVPITETPVVISPLTPTPIVLDPSTITETVAVPTIPTVPNTRWWDVYFTDPLTMNNPDVIAGSLEEKLIQLIQGAQVSIHIASFEFNLTPVAQALIEAKNRGVDVKWVADDKNGLDYDNQPGRGQFGLMAAAGIELKDDDRTALMHNKFWIFDQQIVWTGSTNITVNGIFKQNNNVIVMRSPEIAYIYEREFQELWNGQFGPRAPSTVSNQWAILDGTPIQVLFSAEDHAINNLIALVNDAQSSIRFLAFSFTDYPLAQAMIDRAKAGVDLKGIYETFGSNSIGSELTTFLCAGMQVRRDDNDKSILHNKVIIIDNAIVATGSFNFSSNADESNEENLVIVDNPEIAALYLQEFDKLWNQTHEVTAGTFVCE
jgi:phosphatidylserine/phosphatidylglycerophosphate/cardiolipin synthase-like enzyme